MALAGAVFTLGAVPAAAQLRLAFPAGYDASVGIDEGETVEMAVTIAVSIDPGTAAGTLMLSTAQTRAGSASGSFTPIEDGDY